ncbi:MAG: rhomboid family intramembrane serine protease [Chloroflexota bacterium]
MFPVNDPDLHRSTRPWVIYALVAVNVLVFLYQLALSQLDGVLFTYHFGLVPAELVSGAGPGIERFRLADGSVVSADLASTLPSWATVFTSMFVHGGVAHVLGNMVFLWVFGDNVEDRFGHQRFLLFYLAAGIAAAAAQVAVDPASQVPMVGASGAIAGVLGAYLLLFPYSRVDTLVIVGLIFHLRIRAVWLIGGWAALQTISGLGSLGVSSAGSGVAYFAHLGGFVLGAGGVVVWRLAHGQRPWQGRPPRPRWGNGSGGWY